MSGSGRSLDPATIAVRGGSEHVAGVGVSPPIHVASTFVHAGLPAAGEYTYGRSDTPSNAQLELVLAELEGGSDAVVFNAGIAAANAVLDEALPGTALVMPEDAYYGIRVKAQRDFPLRGVEVRLVDQTNLNMVESALEGASFLWAETPTNPLLAVADLARLGEMARGHGVPWAVDNTFATSVLQHPLEFGAVASMHSLTKYVGGHSDLLLGAVITNSPDLAARLRARRNESGTQGDGFSIWLARRGLQTMPLRVERQSTTALELANRLTRHNRVERVFYPGLEDHPGHHIAARQMKGGFGGMFSLLVRGDQAAAQRVVDRCQIWVPATSLGGVESLIERRARWSSETAPANLLRLSAGLEAVEDLWADLEQALE